MIKLYGFGPALGVEDLSPFVMKINAYMRMARLEFEMVNDLFNLQKSPRGKLPYIEDEGEIIADSHFIIEHLKSKHGNPLEDWLSDEQKAHNHLIIRSLDENLYWCLVYSRWLKDDSWPTLKKALFGHMPIPIRNIAPGVARKTAKTQILKQGMGKHSYEQIETIAKSSFESLSCLLSNKNFFFGDQPSTLDAVAFAFLTEFIAVDLDNPLNQLARSFENLVAFQKRVHEKYYLN